MYRISKRSETDLVDNLLNNYEEMFSLGENVISSRMLRKMLNEFENEFEKRDFEHVFEDEHGLMQLIEESNHVTVKVK